MEYNKEVSSLQFIKFSNTVKIGGKILYNGYDASEWLAKQKDRNVKCCAKLSFT